MIVEVGPEFMSTVHPHLSDEDDPYFWVVALSTVIHDVEQLYAKELKKHDVFLHVGASSHWLRPHQTRLKAAGGFAYPSGYLGGSMSRAGLPEFDWSVILWRDRVASSWVQADKFFGKRKLICRIALPTRTRRHKQAAVNVFWSPGAPEEPGLKRRLFYGFRNVNGEWECVASEDL